MKAAGMYRVSFCGRARQRRPGWVIGDARALLDELSRGVGAQTLSGPHLMRHGQWIVGVVAAADSCVSVHLDCEWGQAFVNVFSCREFDQSLVLEVVARRLNVVRYDYQYSEAVDDAA